MPSQTFSNFLDILKASNLLDDSRIESVVLDVVAAQGDDDPHVFAERLVKDALLTRW